MFPSRRRRAHEHSSQGKKPIVVAVVSGTTRFGFVGRTPARSQVEVEVFSLILDRRPATRSQPVLAPCTSGSSESLKAGLWDKEAIDESSVAIHCP